MRIQQRIINMTNVELPTEINHKRSSGYTNGTIKILVALTILSVAHRALQEFTLNVQDVTNVFDKYQPYLIALMFTIVEAIPIVLAFKIEDTGKDAKERNNTLELKTVLFLSHVLCGLFSHLWMGIDKDVYTNAPRYFEPFMAIILCKICFGFSDIVRVAMVTLITSIGASLITSPLTVETLFGRKAVLLYLSSVFMTLRNIVLKHMHDKKFQLRVRKKTTVAYFSILAPGTITLLSLLVYDRYLRLMLVVAFLSSLMTLLMAALVWLYILKEWMPVDVAMWSAFLSVLNAVIFLQVHLVPNLFLVFVGLCLVSTGIILRKGLNYERDLLIDRTVSCNEMLTRMEFLVFISFVCGMCLYRFPPAFGASHDYISIDGHGSNRQNFIG